MGRQGNLVLVGENGKVIDAIHRVDFAASESRPLLSGLEYAYPPRQDKLDLTVTTPLDAADRLLSGPDLPQQGAAGGAGGGFPPFAGSFPTALPPVIRR